RGDGSANGPGDIAVVGNAAQHQKRAQVGVAQAQCAEGVAQLGDLAAGKLSHEDADLQHDRPDAARVTEGFNIEPLGFHIEKLDQVERCKIASSVVEEHVLGAVVDDDAVRH